MSRDSTASQSHPHDTSQTMINFMSAKRSDSGLSEKRLLTKSFSEESLSSPAIITGLSRVPQKPMIFNKSANPSVRRVQTHQRINSACSKSSYRSYLPSLNGSTESTQNCSTPDAKRRNIDMNQVIQSKYRKELKKLCSEQRSTCCRKEAINIREYLKH